MKDNVDLKLMSDMCSSRLYFSCYVRGFFLLNVKSLDQDIVSSLKNT